ncbi:MAG: dTMP kinase [Thermovirgaceae bacterium]|nr:dTMP kinase [Thermovirgaceae bacterium]
MFVTFEGIDGSGKSTQSTAVFESLSRVLGEDRVLKTHEPGGWSGGETIRNMIISQKMESIWAEVMLFLADRSEHVERIIRPALLSGMVVLCERFSDSTAAYQAFGRDFPKDVLDEISRRAQFPVPDITFWFDVPVPVAMERITSRKSAPDRFEADEIFLERISRGYESIFRNEPERVFRLDGRIPSALLTENIVSRILKRITT